MCLRTVFFLENATRLVTWESNEDDEEAVVAEEQLLLLVVKKEEEWLVQDGGRGVSCACLVLQIPLVEIFRIPSGEKAT